MDDVSYTGLGEEIVNVGDGFGMSRRHTHGDQVSVGVQPRREEHCAESYS